eukprot:TRINITY_DN20704_c0_g1::TRINITY_DN20704_c0_g1_i1::g.9129::m.9129 TRINITY_DN20704_c0_g1::TRINITY_DN20704_c0_g1_i1::g.9129  ORF type:complete len:153 (+),score=30.51,sp/P84339/CALM_AGABI/46.31/3e-37,sp/P84339/CALM_AGABI/45.45/7e-11,EF-hand_8/PF13833.1/0.0044,EF-hand_8/PF13833.1/7.4e-13,EF-hand_8/PF13833.1/2e+02,EF-hand_8/PF13833.1/0.043,EF-hand_1/PF00036.27/5.3e-06,EF-hand_1/PF00036.27/2.2e-08,EF-hand_1/PF00036.27/52,EF-hand_1/PF00036.27/0.019,EF-hand_7/PF13499.1/5.9e-14,EF-hand_7/PF13499.1/0.24,EF
MAHLTEEELQEFQEIFNLVDTDGGGSIQAEELQQLMEMLGLKPTREEIEDMIKEIDEDGNGEIDFDEFVTVMSRKAQPTYPPDEIKAAFKLFETDGMPPGHVKFSALERALTTYGPHKLTIAEADELLSQVPDPDNTGVLNYEEYINMMTST